MKPKTKELTMPTVMPTVDDVLQMSLDRKAEVMKELDEASPGWEFDYANPKALLTFSRESQTAQGSDARTRLRRSVLQNMEQMTYMLGRAAYCLQNRLG